MSMTKQQLCDELRALNAVPPSDATAQELLIMLKRVRALKAQKAERVPPPVPRPKFTPESVTLSPGETLATARVSSMSDHRRRPYDPHAGW